MCSQSTWKSIIAFLLCMCFYMPGFAFASGAFLPIERTEIQSQKSNYVPIEEVGSYRSDVITKELIDHCALPPATAAELPYWTGYILENKIYTQEGNEAWRSYAQGGPRVFWNLSLNTFKSLVSIASACSIASVFYPTRRILCQLILLNWSSLTS